MAVFAGSTPKYLIRLRNEAGTQLNPSDLTQVTEVKVFLYNALTGAYVARFILNASTLPAGYTKLTTKVLDTSDTRVLMVLTAAMTLAAEGNRNLIQVNVEMPDAEVPSGTKIVILSGKFHEILKAKT